MDKELLDRAPSLFLLLSAIWASMQIIGVGFMRDPTEDELSQLVKLSETGNKNLEANVDKSNKPYSVLPSQARKLSVFWRLWIIRVGLCAVTSHRKTEHEIQFCLTADRPIKADNSCKTLVSYD